MLAELWDGSNTHCFAKKESQIFKNADSADHREIT